jgi:hypothetical protein
MGQSRKRNPRLRRLRVNFGDNVYRKNCFHSAWVEKSETASNSPTKGHQAHTPTDPTFGTYLHSNGQLSRCSWAKLAAGVYETDPLQFGHCVGRMKFNAFVVQATMVKKILAHVGLPTDTPKLHPARRPPQSD